MKKKLKHMQKEFHLRGIDLGLFLLTLFVVVIRWPKWSARLSSEFKVHVTFRYVVTTTLKMLASRRRRGASFNSLSLPISSRSNGWTDSTSDANIGIYWFNGKENPVHPQPFHNRLINFFASLTARTGFLALAWVIFDEQSHSKSRLVRLNSLLAQLDIAILVKCWNKQLGSFYESGIWFDPDSIEAFRDSLSVLFLKLDEIKTNKIVEDIKAISPNSSVVEEMFGEFMESEFKLEAAFEAYARSASYNPLNGTAGIKYSNLASLTNNTSTNINQIAVILETKKVCNLSGATFNPKGKNEVLKYDYKIVLGESDFTRSVELTFSSYGVANLPYVFDLGGGLLAHKNNDEYYVLSDTKHLDIRHLKLFSPRLIAHDQSLALIHKPPSHGTNVIKDAFLFPGLGWNYYHWLYETLPYIANYDEISNDGKIPAAFLFTPQSWHLEALSAIGKANLNVVPYFSDKFNIYSNCFFPTHCSRDLVPSPWAIRFLREKLARPRAIRKGKKIFLSRKGVKAVRGMQNYQQVEQFFLRNGFEVVDPSKLSFQKQIDFFSDVEVLAAEGGAALANMVFCPEKTKIIILSAARGWAETFTVISGVLGQDVSVVLGKSLPHPNPYYLWTAFDYTGEINAIKKVIT